MSQRSTSHATFVIDRQYAATPERVFAAWAEPAAKGRWFVGPDEWVKGAHELNFRVGGRERLSGGSPGSPLHTFDARYQDIVPNVRIVSTYDMYVGDERMSVSLATVELKPADGGTRLTYTEQAVFLDGFDIPADREEGTRVLLDQLGEYLQREAASV